MTNPKIKKVLIKPAEFGKQNHYKKVISKDYSISYLKTIITDGIKLKSKGDRYQIIKRFPNNVIRLNNQLISWAFLREILIQGDFVLSINEIDLDLFKKKHGGPRVAGPGKTMGRPKKKIKKVVKSFTFSKKASERLDILASHHRISKSALMETLLNSEFVLNYQE